MKKRNIMKTLFAGTMTLGMALSISPAFAVGDNNVIIGTEQNPAKAYIVKELNIEKGITYEDTFEFDFNLIKEGSTTVNDDTKDKKISITIDSDDSDHRVAKNIFDQDGLTYQTAGIYTYEVTENGTTSLVDGYGLTYSEAKYELVVWVANNAAKDGVYVQKVQVTKKTNDNGENVASGGTKVNPNPTPDEGDGSDSSFKFINTYTKKAGEVDPDHPGHYLSTTISKM